MAKITRFEELSKKLGILDKERREIIKQLKSDPNYVITHLNYQLANIIRNKLEEELKRINSDLKKVDLKLKKK
jgi:hypothetical protein